DGVLGAGGAACAGQRLAQDADLGGLVSSYVGHDLADPEAEHASEARVGGGGCGTGESPQRCGERSVLLAPPFHLAAQLRERRGYPAVEKRTLFVRGM